MRSPEVIASQGEIHGNSDMFHIKPDRSCYLVLRHAFYLFKFSTLVYYRISKQSKAFWKVNKDDLLE